MIGVDLDNKVFCQFCNDYFVKGTGHMCFCADCHVNGRPDKHPMCNPCYNRLITTHIIRKTNYKLDDLSPELSERLK